MFRTTALLFIFIFLSFQNFAQFKVIFSTNYPPFSYVNEKGELDGFNVDILNELINLYNSEIEISGGSWKTINAALENGNVHAIGGTHYPGSIDNNYIYTRSTINTSHCFFYNRNYIKKFSLELLRTSKKPRVAMWKNDVLIHYILSINPSTEFIFAKDYEELLNYLEEKDITCIIAQRIGGMYYADKLNRDYIRPSHHRLLERNMGFKVSKDHPELAKIINNGLEVIMSNGKYQEIYDKWIKEYNKDKNDWHNYLRYIILGGILILLLIVLLILANQYLQNKVRNRTKDLQQQLDLNSQMVIELKQEKIRAEESEKMKSAFLANMSHEIRTPMNGILGFTDLLNSPDFTKDEQEQFIDVIRQSGQRMLSTINNILDVSKLESGVEKAVISKVNIKEVLNELYSFFIHEAQSKSIDLIVEETDNSYAGDFYSDEYKLNSICTNLIKNALKFTKSGHIKIAYSVTPEQAEIKISDTGIGIAKEKQDAIFHQFVQADFSHASGFEGSGLGLSITKGYTNLIKGSIRVESELNVGTTFYVTIPNLKVS